MDEVQELMENCYKYENNYPDSDEYIYNIIYYGNILKKNGYYENDFVKSFIDNDLENFKETGRITYSINTFLNDIFVNEDKDMHRHAQDLKIYLNVGEYLRTVDKIKLFPKTVEMGLRLNIINLNKIIKKKLIRMFNPENVLAKLGNTDVAKDYINIYPSLLEKVENAISNLEGKKRKREEQEQEQEREQEREQEQIRWIRKNRRLERS